MKRFLSYLLCPRGIVAALVIAAACFLSFRFSVHHHAEGPFQTLYMHIIPSPLVVDNHVESEADLEPILGEFGFPHIEFGALGNTGWRESSPGKTVVYNLQLFQLAAVALVFVCFLGVPRYLRTGKGDPLTKLAAGFAMWIRDEVVYPDMGKELGRKFLPYFLCVFFFILFMNLMGLVPFSATATASIFVTGALALTTFIAMIVCGMVAQGPGAYWKNLVPHVPLALWPLMFIVEVIGLLVKPFALMVRLFANMSGGHMVVLSFMALIFFMAGLWGDAGGWGAAPIGVGFAVFIMIIEVFVAMLQAYIFTKLSVIFVNASVHPEH